MLHALDGFLPVGDFFLSDQGRVLNVANALSTFGFPWNLLGKVYVEESCVFGKDYRDLICLLDGFLSKGFDTSSVVGFCLAFPSLLSRENDALFECLKVIYIDYDLKSRVEGNMDVSYEFGRKVKVFVDLGCDKKEIGEIIGKNLRVFFECSEEALREKVSFFQRLDGKGEDIGMLILRYPEILCYDFENTMFCMVNYFKQFGMTNDEVNDIALKFPYVMGKNTLQNLPLESLYFH